ncbi:hypothetical protein [Arthrobacter sp. D5-1]|uniref:hypothetical protein n=1 Tax=Arthrobacter sp. D5-1 TaxID=1477518 RepID=UPI001A9847C5|nr:hypothetical protein [Arthrobacter sp. D5-1]
MENLFSHPASEPEPSQQAGDALQPLIFTVVVPTNVSHAFQGFTDHPHLWWPLEQESVFGGSSRLMVKQVPCLEI